MKFSTKFIIVSGIFAAGAYISARISKAQEISDRRELFAKAVAGLGASEAHLNFIREKLASVNKIDIPLPVPGSTTVYFGPHSSSPTVH